MGKKKEKAKIQRNYVAETEQRLTGSRAGAHKNRTKDVRKGSSRKVKHKDQDDL